MRPPRRLLTAALASATVALVPGPSTGFNGPAFAAGGAGAAVPKVTAHYSEVEAITTGSSRAATGSAYAFDTVLSGQPVRWNPCAPIHWRFRPAGAPAGAEAQVKRAVARIASLTGTTWVYDGKTTATPTKAALPKSLATLPPVLIGWTTPAESDLLRNQPSSTLGTTRTAWFGFTVKGKAIAAIRGAVIALNARKTLRLTGAQSWYTVILHELAHAAGLAHAGSSRQLMYPYSPPGLTDLQSGDIAGLKKVGRSAGCIKL